MTDRPDDRAHLFRDLYPPPEPLFRQSGTAGTVARYTAAGFEHTLRVGSAAPVAGARAWPV